MKNRSKPLISSLLLIATILSTTPIQIAHASTAPGLSELPDGFGGGQGGSGTNGGYGIPWRTSDYGYRIYIIDNECNVVSDVVDIINKNGPTGDFGQDDKGYPYYLYNETDKNGAIQNRIYKGNNIYIIAQGRTKVGQPSGFKKVFYSQNLNITNASTGKNLKDQKLPQYITSGLDSNGYVVYEGHGAEVKNWYLSSTYNVDTSSSTATKPIQNPGYTVEVDKDGSITITNKQTTGNKNNNTNNEKYSNYYNAVNSIIDSWYNTGHFTMRQAEMKIQTMFDQLRTGASETEKKILAEAQKDLVANFKNSTRIWPTEQQKQNQISVEVHIRLIERMMNGGNKTTLTPSDILMEIKSFKSANGLTNKQYEILTNRQADLNMTWKEYQREHNGIAKLPFIETAYAAEEAGSQENKNRGNEDNWIIPIINSGYIQISEGYKDIYNIENYRAKYPDNPYNGMSTLIATNHLRVVMEPVFWFIPQTGEIRNGKYYATHTEDYIFYGTLFDYANWVQQVTRLNTLNITNYSLIHKAFPKAMLLAGGIYEGDLLNKDNIFRRSTNGVILNQDGNEIQYVDNDSKKPTIYGQSPLIQVYAQQIPTGAINSYATLADPTKGYCMHYYEFGGEVKTSGPAKTKTYDETFKTTPEAETEELRHKAPRPNEEEWAAKGADPKTWTYNIVKVYETYYLKDNLGSTNNINEKYLEFFNTDEAKIYTHKFDATKYETTEPGIIDVQHEDEYKVVGAITSMVDLNQYKPLQKVDGGLVYSDGSKIMSAEDPADLSYINNGSDWYDIKSAVEKLDPTTVKYTSTYSEAKHLNAGESMTQVVLGPENITILTSLSNEAIENFENELAGTGYRPLDLFWLNDTPPEYLNWSEEMKNKVIAAAEKHLNIKVGIPTQNNSEITYEEFIRLLGYRMSLENLEKHTTLYVHLIRIDEPSATHTFDKITNPGGNPHPAPDPRNDPDPNYTQQLEDNDPYLKYRIVKVYEEAYEGFENDPSKINTVSINITEPTVNKIDIQDEPEYKVIEYTYGYPGINVREQTNYEDMLINARRLHSEILDDMINENKYNIGIPDDSNNDKSGLMYNDINAIKRYKITDKDREESKDGVLTQVNIFDVNQVTNQIEDETSTLFVRLRKVIPTPGTNTWDNKEYPEGDPGPAPEVIPDPKLPDIYKYRIVKVYETEDTETGEINTVEVNERTNVPPRIQIDDEPYYKLVEWVYGEPNNPVTPTSTWNTVTNGVPNTNHGTKPEEVNIADGNKVTTLYVRLRRKIVTPPPALDEDLTESQLTKISNTNSTTFGWAGFQWHSYLRGTQSTGSYATGPACPGHDDGKGGVYYDHCKHSYAACTVPMISRYKGENVVYVNFKILNNSDYETAITSNRAHIDFMGKTYGKGGQIADSIEFRNNNVSDSGFSETLNSNGKLDMGIEYITTISRTGKTFGDNLNIAKYKKNAIDSISYSRINTIAPESNTPNTNRKANGIYNNLNISYIFGHDTNNKDIDVLARCSASPGCCGIHSVHTDPASVQFTATIGDGTRNNFKGSFKIYTYAGDKAKTARTTSTLADGFYVRHGSSDTNISRLFHSQQSATIKFYPYIRMSYMITKDNIGFKDFNSFEGYRANPKSSNSRTVYVLSTKQSTIVPTNAVEVSWNNDAQRKNGAYGLQMTSQQWSTHNRATTGDEWRKPNQVLPGGALYYLNTSGTESTIKTVTYNTLVDNDSRTWISVSNPEKYTIPSIIKSTQNYLNEAENVMENYRIVQWVNRDWNLTNAWDGQATNRVKIKTGGESLSNLGMSHKASTDSKYLLINGGNKNDVAEGDIDIINKVYTTNIYKGYTNTNGDIYMAWVEVKSSSNKLDEATLTKAVNYLKQLNGTDTPTGSLDSNMQYHSPIKIGTKKNSKEAILENLKNTNYGIYTMDQKTGYVSNLIDSVERNTGMDKNATWLEVKDGKWYNEAFDGYYMVVQEAYYQVGLRVPNRRMSVLDPNLCPKNTGVSDLFSTAFISQFRINEKSTVAEDKEDGYLGTFEDMRVIIPDLPLLMYSRPFYIPNVNVQDLT